jgi:uncharacterized protein YllA (UPF0747 family)
VTTHVARLEAQLYPLSPIPSTLSLPPPHEQRDAFLERELEEERKRADALEQELQRLQQEGLNAQLQERRIATEMVRSEAREREVALAHAAREQV